MNLLSLHQRPALTGAAIAMLVLGLAACQQKTDAPAPVATAPVAATDAAAATSSVSAGESEHRAGAPQSAEDARAQGHREGMDMERDAHERGMEMGAKAHADGMTAKGDTAAPMKKADPPMKMDGHM